MKKSYTPHVAIIRDAISAIERYRPASKEVLLADELVQDAILMRPQVIGEHLSRMRRIDEDRFAAVAQPDWFKIIGLRYVISHGYESIEWELVWLFIHDHLTNFAASLDLLDDKRD
jgi:uncharacterized protein with HEPN domain